MPKQRAPPLSVQHVSKWRDLDGQLEHNSSTTSLHFVLSYSADPDHLLIGHPVISKKKKQQPHAEPKLPVIDSCATAALGTQSAGCLGTNPDSPQGHKCQAWVCVCVRMYVCMCAFDPKCCLCPSPPPPPPVCVCVCAGQRPQCSCDKDLGKTVAGPRVSLNAAIGPGGVIFTRSRQPHVALHQRGCWDFLSEA